MVNESKSGILIDEQLKKVGWEVDISKGKRLTNGRNIGTEYTESFETTLSCIHLYQNISVNITLYKNT